MKTLYHRIFFAVCLFLFFGGKSFASNNKGIGLTLISDSISTVNCSRSDSTGAGGGPGGSNQDLMLTINAWLTNYDSASYTGPVSFGVYDSDSVFFQQSTALTVIGLPAGRPVTIGGNEKIAVTININFPAQFRPGPDVVVVWPITQAPAVDSVSVDIILPNELGEQLTNSTAGISNVQSGVFSYIVLQDKIELVNLSAGLNFKQVRIFNMGGQQLVTAQSDNIIEINLPDLPHGIYNCELLASDNTRKVIRFFH